MNLPRSAVNMVVLVLNDHFLTRAFGDRLVLPADARYDQARAVFNSGIDRKPAAVLYCLSEDDVRGAIELARQEGLPVAVRSTGHNIAGRSTADGALLMDVSGIDGVTADKRGIVVGGGAKWRKIDAISEEAGVAVTGGTVSSTGVGGLTLGGGIGWLLPSFGLSCDSLASARLVTATGEIVEANDVDTPELMWALRGSGTSPGVVTEFRFLAHRLHPIHAGSITVELELMGEWASAISDLLEDPGPSLMAGPSFLFRDGQPVLSLDIALHGPDARDLARIDVLRRLPGIIRDSVRDRSYCSLQTMIDEPNRKGLRSYWTAAYLDRAPRELITGLADEFRRSPSDRSVVFLENLHGAFARPQLPSAFPARESRLSALVTGAWHDAAEDEQNMAWITAVRNVLSACRSDRASYLNYASDLSTSSLGRDTGKRISSVRAEFDPLGLFL
jgi:FAD binding domain